MFLFYQLKNKAFFLILLLVLATGLSVLFYSLIIFPEDNSRPQLITEGDNVSIEIGEDNSWVATATPAGFAFRYPLKLLTSYISEASWPPQVTVEDQQFVCSPSGNEIKQGGQTELRTVDNRSYCLTKASEGAAGSVYTAYAYKFPRGNQTGVVAFTLRFIQCQNYDEPKASECENERLAFDVDGLADRIAQSLTIELE